MAERPRKSIEQVVEEDGRYSLMAVQFVREGLTLAMSKEHGSKVAPGDRRHVSGAQVCESLRELAIHRWGMMAKSVLNRWNITQTRDFGEIVFLMIANGWMQKEPTDAIEDFDNIYNFETAFSVDIELPEE